MNILRENIEQLNDIITIEISSEDYREKVEKSLKELKRKANLPGFRAGHVPMGMINKMYGKSVTAEEISKIINDNLLNYIKENNINIIFEPLAMPDKTKGDIYNNDQAFSFSFELGLYPEFQIDYSKLKDITYLKVIADEKQIEKEIHDLQHRMGKFSSTEEVVKDDMLLVTVLAEGDIKEEFTANLLLNYIKEDKLKDIIGKKVKDTLEINTKEIFKSDYERATFLKTKVDDLDKAPENISLRIDAIHHIEPAAIDDDFFEKAFPNKEVTDEKSLRKHVAENIELSHERDEKTVFRLNAMKQIMENTKINLPDSFIKRYLTNNQSDYYTPENIEEKYAEARKSIIQQLIEDTITKESNLHIDKAEIIHYIKDYIINSYFGTGKQHTLTPEEEEQVTKMANDMASKEDNVKNAYTNILNEKIIAELIKQINPKIKRVSFEAFIDSFNDESKKKKEKKTKEKKESTTKE
ncbi:MAG: trigger factor [Bacteroidales bacterium]|jgi:trigger factor